MNPINVFIKDTILCPYKPFAQSLQLCVLFVTLWTVAHQAPLSMGFSRQDYSSGLPCPPPGDLPNPGIKPTSPALADGFYITEPPWKPISMYEKMGRC